MCSLNEDEGGCETYISQEKLSLSELTTCRSCTNKALVVLRKKDAYCKECFLASETHKFRAALGKSKMMKPQDRVLVSFSGSQSSLALLHLLRSGVNEKHHKRILFDVKVLFIEEGALFKINVEERMKLTEEVKHKMAEFEFPAFISTLSEIFNESPAIDCLLRVNQENDAQLVKLFDNIKTLSSKEDLLYLLRQKLVLKIASKLNCNKIFTAEVANDLAVKLLSHFSLGRGDQASFDTGFCDARFPDCKILRPLKDFLKKEIVFYNRFYNLDSLNILSFATKLPSNVSIQKLTEKFVVDLQEEFSSTVSTIFRTGEKLSASTTDSQTKNSSCLLCDDKFRTNSIKGYSAVDSLNFSKTMSNKKLNNCIENDKTNCCCSCSSEENITKQIKNLNLQNNFCYGCSAVVNDLGNTDLLPKQLIFSGIKKINSERMKEQISEFLIEDS